MKKKNERKSYITIKQTWQIIDRKPEGVKNKRKKEQIKRKRESMKQTKNWKYVI